MPDLLLRHLAGTDPPRFEVQRPGGKGAPPVEVRAPAGFPVEGRPTSDLVRELAWYLETFLDYPFSPETEHADRVIASLRAWGEAAFSALFGNRDGGRAFDGATQGGYEDLLLQIWSDDARILAWPWEALRDPKAGELAPQCRIERRLNEVPDPAPVPSGLPADRVNILLVIARPLEGDIKYRSIARPLVELIGTKNLPAYVAWQRAWRRRHLLPVGLRRGPPGALRGRGAVGDQEHPCLRALQRSRERAARCTELRPLVQPGPPRRPHEARSPLESRRPRRPRLASQPQPLTPSP